METSARFKGTSPIPFGAYATDKVTKDSGYVTAKFYQLSGCCSILLTTQLRNEKNLPVRRDVTDTRLEIDPQMQGHNPFDGVETWPEESNFHLGERVKCELYGVEGVINCIAFYADTAPHIEIQPPYNKAEGKMPDAVSVTERYVVSLDNPAQALPDVAAKRASPAGAPTAPRSETSRRE